MRGDHGRAQTGFVSPLAEPRELGASGDSYNAGSKYRQFSQPLPQTQLLS